MSTVALSSIPPDDFKTRYPDHAAVDAHAAVRFLCEAARGGPMTVVTIAVGGAVRHRVFDTADTASVTDMRSFVAFHETQPSQVFYLPNAARGDCLTVPANEDIAWIRSIVLDFDPDKSKPLDEERDRLRAVAHDLIHGPLQPRAVVDTGGGMQAVFQLLEPIAATEITIAETELLMKSLARSLGADTATCKVKNLFRVPGTKNWPTPAKKAAGRVQTFSGVWHSGGPRCSLGDLQALATVRIDDVPPSAPVEFGDLDESAVRAVLRDPAALPAVLVDLLRDPMLHKAVNRPAPPDDTSKGDYVLACDLLRCRLSPRDAALVVSAYGHKVERAFHEDRLFSYVVHTVERAAADVRIDHLLEDFDDEAAVQEQHALRQKKRARLKPMSMAEAVSGLFDADNSYLVQGFMRRGELMVMYGKPGSGKTFLALDLAMHVALGREWNGRHVKAAAVVYIAAELPLGVRYRLKALADRYGGGGQFFLVAASVNMFDHRVDLKPLVDEIAGLNVEVGMIVIDTLARTMIGGNENSTQDMSQLIANGDVLRDRFGAAMVWIHHTGKNEAAGARGSSALVAATDTEIEVTDLTFRSTKMRDREDISYRFRLHQVPVGTMPDGEDVTSCVVHWIEDVAAIGRNTPESNNLKIVTDLLRMRGEMLTMREIMAEAELMGRKFTIKSNSLERALNRSCESDVNKIFVRELTDRKSGKHFIYRYGLVNE